jgi:hypothetical protein
MSKIDLIMAVAGWEDRFVLGVEADLVAHYPEEAVIVVFEEFSEQTNVNRLRIKQLCSANGIKYSEMHVPRRIPARVWQQLQQICSAPKLKGKRVLVDISTMPREVIWWSFRALQSVGAHVSYVYYKPGAYAHGWVTRDTERPRLVYQSSGVSEFGRDTCLLLVSGFDTDRASQMIQFFEPAVTLIATQVGDQFRNESENVNRHKLALGSSPQISYFEVDAYSLDHGLAAMENFTAHFRQRYNVVGASLGPKPSAVALYHLHQKDPNLALAYAPSRQFNPDYSTGIGEAVRGALTDVVPPG